MPIKRLGTELTIFEVGTVSHFLDLIEPWGFCEDLKVIAPNHPNPFNTWTRFRVTGPKSRGPGPITRTRSHKNDFYGTSPIKMLNSWDRSQIIKIGQISRLWEGWNWLILCDSDYLLCYGLLQAFFLSIWIQKGKKSQCKAKIIQILSHFVMINDAGTGLIKINIFMRPGPAFS